MCFFLFFIYSWTFLSPIIGSVLSIIESKIIGGEEAVPDRHEFSFVVQINVEKDEKQHQLCGGALISKLHVLSATHCFLFKITKVY